MEGGGRGILYIGCEPGIWVDDKGWFIYGIVDCCVCARLPCCCTPNGTSAPKLITVGLVYKYGNVYV